MERLYKITIILLLSVVCFSSMRAQESLRERLAKRQQQEQGTVTDSSLKVPKLSVRAEMMNENQTQDLSNATWVREIYRFLDLTKGENAALYYPEQPENNKMNLFTMIFKLMDNNSLPIYRWNNGDDLFIDKMKENSEIKFLAEAYKALNHIYDKNPSPDNINKWKADVVPKLYGSAKIKVSRVEVVRFPQSSYDFTMDKDEH